MNTTVPRRKILQAAPIASIAGLSGCLGSTIGSTSDDSEPSCTMFDQDGEKNPPLRNTKIVPWDGENATLRVTLVAEELEETGAKWINVYEPKMDASNPEYAIPLSVGETGPTNPSEDGAVVYKEQAIGTMPVGGRFRVEVTDGDAVLAWQAFSYDCSGESEQD
ncbi:hypothetical protein [Natrialba sp. PRR66]|uniref:hypothetical protein n=1 Tax=Natrialba sp. PRR66 TaxID=3098146 RepID=UPI002B1D4077|nr:hypothetical protein [Natrialba sp. PRR66]